MCGICGKLEFHREAKVSAGVIKAMADTIVHRGPDDEGFHVSGQVGLGFRRLSIIDLSGGHQPIANEDESVWVIFNGEIYNYVELRNRLLEKGHVFRTHSDTEVLVHLYEEYGEQFVRELRGMFAFAIWDERKRVLLLARDRIGIQPLYYGLTGKSLVFSSEIKAILADPEIEPEINPGTIDRFLSFYYVPGDETLLKNVRKLEPGHYLTVKNGEVQIKQYWDLDFSRQNHKIGSRAAEEELLTLLDEAVRMHMISDVPVGFLISGGVDSAAMLSFAAGKTDKKISSFTVGFSEPGVVDERPYARIVAQAYGSEHHEMTITSRDFADFLPSYMWHLEEPICEPPAVALYYVSKFASNFVKVLISGEGGDEAFAGYPNYRNLLWLERAKKMSGPFQGAFSQALSGLSRLAGSKKIGYYASLARTPFESYYYSRTASPFMTFNQSTDKLYSKAFACDVNKQNSISPVMKYLQNCAGQDVVSRMLYVDSKTWLPNDLLVKADKMTMASSVELRVPLLDHKILEFAASLPSHLKVHHFTTKYLAKKAFEGRVPKEILNRKKAGFPVPYELWLRTELKDWVQDVLFDRKTLQRGYFEKGELERLVSENQKHGALSKEIFSLVALELWHRCFLESKHPVAV